MQTNVETFFLTLQGKNIEVQRIAGEGRTKPTIVFLHEGLGSIATWLDFPLQVAKTTKCPIIVYSRCGYGNSDISRDTLQISYLHDEALIFLPGLLDKLSIRDPVLLGHSDGGSIALIFAGNGNKTEGLILLAPHVFVEDITISGIRHLSAAFENTNLSERLSLYHRDANCTFRRWNDIWLHPDFRAWNIETFLPNITCPILAIQGLEDQYGTLAHLDAIARLTRGPVKRLHLQNCRHSPHRDQPGMVVVALREFLTRLGESRDRTI